ncbi:TlpA family protein disulfide reductase [Sphingomonas alpina]|uniref:TlpA family protein disulfide reductase n=2 Tax=Sphingomonas alpina TaxID=653931 RepID=A0A7H0LQL9_9SPHN|nr:TlpA disulfide reductase family protein [Sphingomonas alpina]QNQ11972.1 TlpA family protein disulfide reductase [Sphingomonas alpina]
MALALVGAKIPKVGDMAPPFEITLVDGSKVTLDQLRGNVVVLNFWATWCAPCREELPLLDRYYELQQKNGLKVFAVTTEGSLPIYQLKKVFAMMKMPAVRKISGPYGQIKAVPTNYIIDRSGRIRYAKAASFDLEDLNANLVPLLNEPVPAS